MSKKKNEGTSPMSERDQALLDYVTRHEFERLTETVHETSTSVAQVVTLVKSQTQNMEALTTTVAKMSTQVAQQGAPKGLNVSTVLTLVSVLGGWSVICGSMVFQFVVGNMTPIQDDVRELKDSVQAHHESGAHGGADSRIAVLEQRIVANHIENETQHKWIVDVLNLQNDWRDRVSAIRVNGAGDVILPPAHYSPLNAAGEGFD